MGGARGKDEMFDDFGTRASAKLRKRQRIGWMVVVETEIHPSGREEAVEVIVKRQRKGGKPEEVAAEAFLGSVADAVEHGCELAERDAAGFFPHP